MNLITNAKKSNAPDWVKEAMCFLVAFAQGCEDPFLEAWVVNAMQKKDMDVLMIASGGCTVVYLAAHDCIRKMDRVDASAAQLILTQYKPRLLENFDDHERMAVLGRASCTSSKRCENFEHWCAINNYDATIILGNIHSIAQRGVNFSGRYKQLFAQVQRALFEHTLFLEPLLKGAVTEYADRPYGFDDALRNTLRMMCLDNVGALFGADSVQNLARPLWAHFFHKMIYGLHHHAKNNPFFTRFLLDHRTDSVLSWIKLDKQTVRSGVYYHHMDMEATLNAGEHQYDFVHLSNMLNWVSEKKAQCLLANIQNRLKSHGHVIIRPLNSSLKIDQLGAGLYWYEQETDRLLQQDHSVLQKNFFRG